MPGYKAHLAGGAVAAAPLLYFLRFHSPSYAVLAIWFGCALAGSLFPDIDTNSKAQKWFYRVLFVLLAALLIMKRFFLFAIFTLIGGLPLVVNHRGLFHRLWFVVLIPFAAIAALAWYDVLYFKDAFIATSFFVVGAVSHLILDFGLKGIFRR